MKDKRKVAHAIETLEALREFLSHDAPVYPFARLMEDDRSIQEHIAEAISELEAL